MSGEFGEPWSRKQSPCNEDYPIFILTDSKGNIIADCNLTEKKLSRQFLRAAVCVNALDGIPDPAAYLKELKEKAAEYERIKLYLKDQWVTAARELGIKTEEE